MVLVVDDERAVRRVLRTFLERNSYKVVEAAGGEEALALFAAQPEIDLLITDLRMPGINGNELVRRVLAERPDLPVLFTSAYPGEIDEAFSHCEVLAKPFTGAQLIRKVARLTGVGNTQSATMGT